jgi:large conductance mechanosensitive channel
VLGYGPTLKQRLTKILINQPDINLGVSGSGPVAQHGWSVRLIIERSPVQIRLGPLPPKLINQHNQKEYWCLLLASNDEMLEELKKIRTLLEPKPAPPAPPAPKGLWNEFKDFLGKYKVLGLAIAFIMGVYLGGLVQALVKDLLLPVIGLAIPGLGNLATWKIPVPATALDGQGNPIDTAYTGQLFGLGDFLVALITFVIVALVIFLVVKVAKKWGME